MKKHIDNGFADVTNYSFTLCGREINNEYVCDFEHKNTKKDANCKVCLRIYKRIIKNSKDSGLIE